MDIINKPRKQKEKQIEQPEAQIVSELSNEEVKTDLYGKLVVEPVEYIEMTHVALGTFKDSSGQWNVVKIKYNPELGAVGELTSTVEGEKSSAVDRFKIEVVNNKII